MYQIQKKNKPKNREIQAGQRSTIHGSTLFRPKAGYRSQATRSNESQEGQKRKG